MKRLWGMMIVVWVIGFGLIIAGCAKKEPMEKAEEVKPPQAVTQPAPAPEAPKEEMKLAPPAPSGLAEEIAAFEGKNIHFDFDRYDLRADAIAVLDEKAAFLKTNPDMKVQIEGHCDERGTIEYNIALGERRARSAQDYLVDVGIAKDRIVTISYGKERPLDPGHNEDAWAKNRRDHFIVMTK